MEGYMFVQEAAELCGVTEQRIRALIDGGRFPGAVRVGPERRGVWLLVRAEVVAWAASERKPGRPRKQAADPDPGASA